MLEGTGTESTADLIPAVVILGDAEAKVPFESRSLILITENAVEVEMVAQYFSRQYLRFGRSRTQP